LTARGERPLPPPIVCDVRDIVDPDAVTVDALARLALAAARLGHRLELRHVPERLHELLAFAGLSDVRALGVDLRLRVVRQSEQGEQVGGVEERVDAGDPTV
jgi:hypothetical protein